MIDSIYKTLLTILNKENKGYITPNDFNLLANTVQEEIFREYFSDVNRDDSRKDKRMISTGYSNLPMNERQRITQFAASGTIAKASGVFDLPTDLYLIEENGITVTSSGRVIDQTNRERIAHLVNSTTSGPTVIFPLYEKVGDDLIVYPDSIDNISIRYLRKPKAPQWTYVTLSEGQNIFNPSSSSYQDFELHTSEFNNILLRMLALCGVVIRETEVVQIAENMKNTNEIKDNQ